MKVIERSTQHVRPGKRAEVISFERAFDELEKPRGAPAKQRYWLGIGADTSGTFIWQREWESLAAYEAHYEWLIKDKAFQALVLTAQEVFEDGRGELLIPFDI
jgi:hypothetical protein